MARWWDGQRLILDHIIDTIPTATPPGRWTSSKPNAVTGIRSLSCGGAAAITAGGTLATWTSGEPVTSWPLPPIGSPRAIAASPDRSLVAVGIKDNRNGPPKSSVMLIEIEPHVIEERWKTAHTRQVAVTTEQQRTSTGTLDPTMLAVLADALEEAGAPQRVLDHLRTHDRRLRTCWVVDQLCDQTVLPSR